MGKIAKAKPIPTPSFDDDGLNEIRAIAAPSRHNANGIAHEALRQPKPDPRGFRWQVRFWLDGDKLDQLDLGKWIHSLKLSQKFAPTVRSALSLYRELMVGETDMLYQLFPDLKPVPPPLPAKEIEEMQKKIDSLQDQVDLLRGILIKQSSPGAVDMAVKMSSGAGQGSGNIKLLTNNKAAPPPVEDDDDLLVIRKDATSGQRSQENFINSMFALNGEKPMYPKQ